MRIRLYSVFDSAAVISAIVIHQNEPWTGSLLRMATTSEKIPKREAYLDTETFPPGQPGLLIL